MNLIIFQRGDRHLGHFSCIILIFYISLIALAEVLCCIGLYGPVTTSSDVNSGLALLARYLRGTEMRSFDNSEPSSLIAATEAGTRTG